MRLIFLVLGLVLTGGSAVAAGSASPLAPFTADYVTLRNGKEAGHTTLTLRANDDGSWSLKGETRGTAGLARLAGLGVVDDSRLRWRDGHPETLSWDYRQSGGLRQRTRHADFDWANGTVTMRHGEQTRTYPTVPGLIDRQTVTIALMADLARGAEHFDCKVATKARVDELRYRRGEPATVTVPAGRFEAVAVERVPDPTDRRAKVSRNWFAPALGWLPVKMEQHEEDGDSITLELTAWRTGKTDPPPRP